MAVPADAAFSSLFAVVLSVGRPKHSGLRERCRVESSQRETERESFRRIAKKIQCSCSEMRRSRYSGVGMKQKHGRRFIF